LWKKKEFLMQFLMRGMAALALGAGLCLAGTAGAQVTPVSPLQQAPKEPTPVTPSTPVVLPVVPPFCDDLHGTIPDGKAVEYAACLLPVDATTGLLCLTGVAAGGGLTSSCTTVFVTTPGVTPPVQPPVPPHTPTP
jgi:hypothetical protein